MEYLSQLKVAVLATDGFEESELLVPVKALRDAGATVHVVSPHGNKIQALKHFEKGVLVKADRKLEEIQPGEYDAVILPGGVFNADALRVEPHAQEFIRAINDAGKPIAVICHGAWLLVSAGLVASRTLTSWPTLADDIQNAGGTWENREVMVDSNWVSSRKPDDLPAFTQEMFELFSKVEGTRRTVAA